MLKQLIRRSLIISLGLILLTGVQPVYPQAEPTTVSAQQALSHLRGLIDVYQIDLNPSQTKVVIDSCQSLQEQELIDLRHDLIGLKQKYLDALDIISSNLTFIADSLSQMSEDASSVNLASFYLSRVRSDFSESATIYSNSLEELLAIDCQRFPNEFVAGLEEVRVRRQLTLTAAEAIVDLTNQEVDSALQSVKQRLESR